jgi:hypothetical protein
VLLPVATLHSVFNSEEISEDAVHVDVIAGLLHCGYFLSCEALVCPPYAYYYKA